MFKTKVGGDRSSGRGWRRLRAPAARLDRHACPHMSLVVVTVRSSSNSFAFAQPVRGLYSAEQLRRVRDGACDWTGRDAQRRRRGGDGETLALFHAARVACAHIVDVVEALWWIAQGHDRMLWRLSKTSSRLPAGASMTWTRKKRAGHTPKKLDMGSVMSHVPADLQDRHKPTPQMISSQDCCLAACSLIKTTVLLQMKQPHD